MVHLDEFIKTVHDAAIAANRAVANENLKMITSHFERSESVSETSVEVTDVLASARSVLKDDTSGNAEKQNALEDIVDALASLERQSDKGVVGIPQGVLKPRTITLQYPRACDDGLEMVNIEVPTIILAPVRVSEICEIKFSTEMEIHADNDRVAVSFPPKSGGDTSMSEVREAVSMVRKTDEKADTSATDSKVGASQRTRKSGTTTLELTLKPKQGASGLDSLISGYEKMLRAQL